MHGNPGAADGSPVGGDGRQVFQTQIDVEGWFAQVRTVTQATLDAAQMNANSVQQLLSAQVAPQSSYEERGLQGRDLARVLKQPNVFNPSTREEELSMWKSWSWELEQYLGALDNGFTEDFLAMKSVDSDILMDSMDAPVRQRGVLLYSVLAGLLHEKGKQVLKSVEPQNGYEGYGGLEPIWSLLREQGFWHCYRP